jgi:hypothetical protein
MSGLRPEDGVASIALGLGSTVVDGERCLRFSPAEPQRLYQFASTRDYLDNSQREFYALDLSPKEPSDEAASAQRQSDPHLVQLGLDAALAHGSLEAVGSVYSPENDTVYEGIHRPGVKLITMAGVLSGGRFPLPEALSFLLSIGKAGLSCDVEIEFAVNLHEGDDLHELAFLQIRPLVFGSRVEQLDLAGVTPAQAICISPAALGHGHLEGIRDLVYVPPEGFDRSCTLAIADEVADINARLKREERPYLLIGPGRWGSADPWLGIPVTWSQISGVRCMVETDMEEVPVEPSQGSHFFQNITSFGIGYFTVNSRDSASILAFEWLNTQAARTTLRFIRHLRFDQPLEIVVDGRSRTGVIMQPGFSLSGPREA